MPDTPVPTLWHRFRVLLIGVIVGEVFAAWAATVFAGTSSFQTWATAWLAVVGGPILSFAYGIADSPLCGVPWPIWVAALLLIPAHPIRPNGFTAVLTAIGLAIWFFLGFVSVAMCYAG